MLGIDSASQQRFYLVENYPVGYFFFFFFNDTATTEIYTLSLHDALPISWRPCDFCSTKRLRALELGRRSRSRVVPRARSEEHTSELQSQSNLVCRLLLEKKTTPSLH